MKKLTILLGTLLLTITSFALDSEKYPLPAAGEHPRLYIRANEVPALKAKMRTPEGKETIRQIRELSVPYTAEEEAKIKDRGFRYYYAMRGLTSKAELQALDYLTSGNKKAAREAITTMLDSLKRVNFGMKQDLSRASGVMLMVGSIVYDWCYPCFTQEERLEYIKQFKRVANLMECRYPPRNKEPIAGHSSEWMVMRDLLSAGVAVYDEDPEIYNLTIKLLVDYYVPPREYLYNAGNHHQGTSYYSTRYTCELFAQWIVSKACGRPLFSDKQLDVAYEMVYRQRPDDLILPSGDCNPARRGVVQGGGIPIMLAANYWKDPYLAYQFSRSSAMSNHCLFFKLLWNDPNLDAKTPDDLPKVRLFPDPSNSIIARTGWNDNSAIVEMKIGGHYVGNHQHLDAGSFQIYCRGPLALDAGIYQGTAPGGYNSDHCKNYHKRTIAHNSLLFYDPDEVFECYNYGGAMKTQTAANDGGQRLPGDGWKTCNDFRDLLGPEFTVGNALSYSIGNDFTYLKGDIAPAYSDKVSKVVRSFVFSDLHSERTPAVLVIYDSYETSAQKAPLKATWLMHTIEEPGINNGSRQIYVRRTKDDDTGVLQCTALLPRNASISKVGGPGKEFFVNGVNYTNSIASDRAKESGQWRIEISQEAASRKSCFLNVIQIGTSELARFPDVKPIEAGKVVGAAFADRVVLFSKDASLMDDQLFFNAPQDALLMLTDLAPGLWKVSGPNGFSVSIKVEEGQNKLETKIPAGRISISPVK